MFPYTDDTESTAEEELETAVVAPIQEPREGTSAATADSHSLNMDIHLTASKEWCQKFKYADPASRSILLSQLLDAFSDGVEGVYVSFSEPK